MILDKMMVTSSHAIDFGQIRRAVDLRRYVEGLLGPPLKGGRWACPVHGGRGPNFAVYLDDDRGDRWHCFTRGEGGDVIDLVAALDGCSLAEAARRLDPTGAGTPRGKRPDAYTPRKTPQDAPGRALGPREDESTTPPPQRLGEPPGPVWLDPLWQATVDRLVTDAETALWEPGGRDAPRWLRGRGFDDRTIRRFRLGWLPAHATSKEIPALGPRGGGPRQLHAPRGIAFPWVAPGARYEGAGPLQRWVGLNVRQLASDDVFAPLPEGVGKYRALAGSERGHPYPLPDPAAIGDPAIVCEGEIDALTAFQEVGWAANVVSLGGAGQSSLRRDALEFLAACPVWLLLYDNDAAGDDAAWAMTAGAKSRCRRLRPPRGLKDLNDLRGSGAPVAMWLRSEWERLGWRDSPDPSGAGPPPSATASEARRR